MKNVEDHGEKDLHSDLTEQILAAAFEVHSKLGPGLLESAYEACLAYELTLRGIPFARQLSLPLRYKDQNIDVGFRIDLLVADTVIVELKAVDRLLAIHEAQLLTYLKLTEKRVGLLINFNTQHLRNGIKRRVL